MSNGSDDIVNELDNQDAEREREALPPLDERNIHLVTLIEPTLDHVFSLAASADDSSGVAFAAAGWSARDQVVRGQQPFPGNMCIFAMHMLCQTLCSPAGGTAVNQVALDFLTHSLIRDKKRAQGVLYTAEAADATKVDAMKEALRGIMQAVADLREALVAAHAEGEVGWLVALDLPREFDMAAEAVAAGFTGSDTGDLIFTGQPCRFEQFPGFVSLYEAISAP